MTTFTKSHTVWENDEPVGLISRSEEDFDWYFFHINNCMSDAKTLRAVAERLDELNAEIEP